jgi:hypothetical protein
MTTRRIDDISALVPTHRKPERSGVVVWPEPKPLPNGLAPVEPFSSDFLPDALAPWVEDIANRLRCPPDYVAVAALTSLGAVIGRRIVSPQARTDWIEIQIYGVSSGDGMLKSPAMMGACQFTISRQGREGTYGSVGRPSGRARRVQAAQIGEGSILKRS